MRCIGIDYGEKRLGLSYGDDLGVATPLPPVLAASDEERVARALESAQRRKADRIVIGYPYNMDGSVGFKAREVDAFIRRLQARCPLPVHRVDERLTTYEAAAPFGRRRDDARRRSGRIDSAAAALILQDYLDQNLPGPSEGSAEP